MVVNRDYEIWSLFEYRGLIRETILHAKISNRICAVSGLTELIVGDPLTIKLAQKVNAITSAPSSLWGRMRGRFDLAELFAISISKALQIPRIPLPLEFYFMHKKRAGQNQKKEILEPSKQRHSREFEGKCILLIDDIITTGWTMSRTGLNLRNLGAIETIGLTLAHAGVEVLKN
ncbi:MAG: phosphoribosyltransferase family protein [Proteobacteria bacterium]|nr:phosphoribosyltransferase family protein [Pseudomonadota bacterium]